MPERAPAAAKPLLTEPPQRPATPGPDGAPTINLNAAGDP